MYSYYDNNYIYIKENNVFKKILRNFLSKILSRSTKRAIFLISLYNYINRKNTTEKAQLQKLNKILELSADKPELIIATSFSPVIWSTLDENVDIDIRNNINKISSDELTEKVMKFCPYWLIYGSDLLIKRDLNLLMYRV